MNEKFLNISSQIKKIRTSKGFTQKELASAIGVTEQAISQYERGTRTPTLELLKNIAKTLEVRVDELINAPLDEFLPLITGLAKEIDILNKDDFLPINWKDIKGLTIEEFFELFYFSVNFINKLVDRTQKYNGSDIRKDLYIQYIDEIFSFPIPFYYSENKNNFKTLNNNKKDKEDK